MAEVQSPPSPPAEAGPFHKCDRCRCGKPPLPASTQPHPMASHLGCHLRSSKTVQSVYRIAASIAHAQGWLSTPLAREYVCQWCGKALPPLGIEPLPPAPKARALKDRAIWTLVLSHRYRREVHIQYTLPQLLFPLRARTHYATFFFFFLNI